MSQLTEKELEDLLAEIGRQILDQGTGTVGRLGQWGCTTVSVEICPDRVHAVLNAGACRFGVANTDSASLTDVAGYIDHTLLKAETTLADIDELCHDALRHGFASVCVNGVHVRRCAEILAGSKVMVCTVVGFPLGAALTEVKSYEARRAIEDGACEVDMVLNVGAMKSGHHEAVRADVASVAATCHGLGARLKVILETCLLTKDEIVAASELCKAAGADFVKTSTGFSSGGATVEDVALMRRAVGPVVGVKASGGVRDAAAARAMLEAGATRIGASASVAIARGTPSATGSGY